MPGIPVESLLIREDTVAYALTFCGNRFLVSLAFSVAVAFGPGCRSGDGVEAGTPTRNVEAYSVVRIADDSLPVSAESVTSETPLDMAFEFAGKLYRLRFSSRERAEFPCSVVTEFGWMDRPNSPDLHYWRFLGRTVNPEPEFAMLCIAPEGAMISIFGTSDHLRVEPLSAYRSGAEAGQYAVYWESALSTGSTTKATDALSPWPLHEPRSLSDAPR